MEQFSNKYVSVFYCFTGELTLDITVAGLWLQICMSWNFHI